jgi:hypothetical protein
VVPVGARLGDLARYSTFYKYVPNENNLVVVVVFVVEKHRTKADYDHDYDNENE